MSLQSCRNDIMDVSRATGEHAGLLLSRYLKVAVKDKENHPKDRGNLLECAIKAAKAMATVPIYSMAFKRLEAVSKAAADATDTLKVQGRLMIGLGNDNVLETGLTLHHTYGTPIIPGSALKGLAAHYCDQVWGGAKDSSPFKSGGENYLALFGSQEDSGHLIFKDAWVTPETLDTSLVLDVMTPHHGAYYSDETGATAPTDFDGPNPITFLSVKGDFWIAVACDAQDRTLSSQWAGLGLTLLKQALEHWGVGGKTNAGYGRMIGEQGHTRSLNPLSDIL